MTDDTPVPAAGQIWLDCDPRGGGHRTIRVEHAGATHADCTVLTDALGRECRRKTRIRVDRLTPTSTGYRYLRTESTQESDT